MNGRIYDYNLGRFMSVDPFIQSPTSTQSVNPYSYIMNNPLAGTDPTGYACEAATGTRICSKDIGDIKVKDVSKITITKNDNGSAKVSVTMNNGSVRSQNFNLSSAGGLGDIASKQSYGNDPNFAKGYGSLKGDMSGILSMTGPALAVDAVKAGIETASAIADEYEQSGLSMSTFIIAGKAAGEAAIDVGAKKFRLPGVAKKVSSGAENVNAQSALSAKLSGLEKAQQNGVITRQLPDGRVRYYTKEVLARTEGPTRGASFVTEHNPKTGNLRQWMESYNHSGQVNRVHPKSVNGQTVNSQHYPPTARELGL